MGQRDFFPAPRKRSWKLSWPNTRRQNLVSMRCLKLWECVNIFERSWVAVGMERQTGNHEPHNWKHINHPKMCCFHKWGVPLWFKANIWANSTPAQPPNNFLWHACGQLRNLSVDSQPGFPLSALQCWHNLEGSSSIWYRKVPVKPRNCGNVGSNS